MTEDSQAEVQEQKQNDKDLNFRALESKYQKELEKERQARSEIEKRIQEYEARQQQTQDDDDYDEPYVDYKKLEKKLAKFGEQTTKQTKSEIDKAVSRALQEERNQNWIKQHNDFNDVMQHANKLAEMDPELAETILQMPEGFERQKLVYRNIKALRLNEPKKDSETQEKINSNRRGPYYQPSGMTNPPYASQGDFSQGGQKNAYAKMKELQARLRI